MIYESYPWKQDLRRRRNLLLNYNKPEQFEKDYDKACTVVEKSILYSAFIIRKLIDCDRLSTQADERTLKASKYVAIKEFNKIHRFIDESSHDWENARNTTIKARNICNWLIHSYIFDFLFCEDGQKIESFAVASDYDRNEVLYVVEISDWIEYMDFIATDNIVYRRCSAEVVRQVKDKDVMDYVSKVKERG